MKNMPHILDVLWPSKVQVTLKEINPFLASYHLAWHLLKFI